MNNDHSDPYFINYSQKRPMKDLTPELLRIADRVSGSNGWMTPDERNAIATKLRTLAASSAEGCGDTFCGIEIVRDSTLASDQISLQAGNKRIILTLDDPTDTIKVSIPDPPAAADDPATGGLTPKQAWWAGYRVGKGLPADTPRAVAVTTEAGREGAPSPGDDAPEPSTPAQKYLASVNGCASQAWQDGFNEARRLTQSGGEDARDADRLDWLAKEIRTVDLWYAVYPHTPTTPAEIRAAIDAAIAAQAESGGGKGTRSASIHSHGGSFHRDNDI